MFGEQQNNPLGPNTKKVPPPPPKRTVPRPEDVAFAPEEIKVDHTQVATQKIPLNILMTGSFGEKYGLEADVDIMNPPTEFLEFDDQGNVIEDSPKTQEYLTEVHKSYLADRDYQNMVQQSQAATQTIKTYTPSIFGNVKVPAPDEIGPGEYLHHMMLSEPLFGKASAYLTGVIEASISGTSTPSEEYRNIMAWHQYKMTKYHPNQVQDIFASIAVIGMDMPFFVMVGGAYNVGISVAGLKVASTYARDALVRGGMPMALADRYATNGIMAINQAFQSGATLGSYAFFNDIADQGANGVHFRDIDWNKAIGHFNKDFIIGGSIGITGAGANFLKHSPQFQSIADNAIKKRLMNFGVNASSFGAEISLFTYGQAFLDADSRVKDVTWSDVINNTGVILGLKGMHTRRSLPKSSIREFNADQYIEVKDMLGEVKRDTDPVKQLVENGNLEAVMMDPDVQWKTKQQLAEKAGVSLPSGYLSEAKWIQNPDGTYTVRAWDNAGTLLEKTTYDSKELADAKVNDYEMAMDLQSSVTEFTQMPARESNEINRRLEKAGLPNGKENRDLVAGVSMPSSYRTAEQSKAVDTFKTIMEEYKAEKAEKTGEKPVEPETPAAPVEKVGEVTQAIQDLQKSQMYTDRDIDLEFEHTDRLQAAVNHPVNGLDKLLSDVQEIRKNGNYEDAKIEGKTLKRTLGTDSNIVRIDSEAKLNEVEAKLQEKKNDIQDEIARRKKEGITFEKGKYELGRKAFDTKQDLFKELDRFPTLEGMLPEVYDYDTMKAIDEYQKIKKGRAAAMTGVKDVTPFERGSAGMQALADRVRGLKGGAAPEPGTLQIRIPGIETVWDGAMEVTAKALEGGAKMVEAIGKGLEYIRATERYQKLTRPQQRRVDKEFQDKLGQFSDEQIANLTEIYKKAEDYKNDITKLKEENPEKYWTVDIPSDAVINKAATEGRLITVEGGSGIVMPDGEIIGLIKTDPTKSNIGKKLIDEAVKLGGNKLYNYSGPLTGIYEKAGFRVVAQVPYDPAKAPKDAPKDNLPETVDYMVLDSQKRLPDEDINKSFTSVDKAVKYWNTIAERMKNGQIFDQFFNDVSAGKKGMSDVKYSPVLKLEAEKHGEFIGNYDKHRGNFDDHITKSIPGHKEIQVVTGKAVVDVLPRGGKVLDIGGSENSWAKAITETSGGKVKTVTVDPNETMRKHSEKTPVEGNEYIDKPFMTGWTEKDGTKIEPWEPTERFDVVHESMAFQFMSNERRKQVEYIVDNVLQKDGMVILEEKFVPGDSKTSQEQWKKNEDQKDAYKEEYFKKEELTKKKAEVIEGMHERMIPSEALEKILSDNFAYVFRYWDSGNFKGYMATNSQAKARAFEASVGTSGESVFSSAPVEYVKDSKMPPKKSTQKKIDTTLSREKNKILVDEYTALKDQIKVEGKSAKIIQQNAQAARDAFNDFLKGKAWDGAMNKRAAKAIWRRVNNMDFTKPGTIKEAMDYIENAINDANFRAELAAFEETYTKLEKFSDPKTYQRKDNNMVKGKGVSVEAQDRIKDIRNRMLTGDPVKAMEEMNAIFDKVDAENRSLTDAEYATIENLQFDGLLNGNHPGNLNYFQNRVADLKDIARNGRTQQAAKRAIKAEERRTQIDNTFNILNAGDRTVELNVEKSANERINLYNKVARAWDWTFQDAWFTLLDKLSRYDKGSKPMQSYLNQEFGGMYLKAERDHYVSKQKVLDEIETAAKKIFNADTKDLSKILRNNASELHTLEWESVGADGKAVKESLDMTMSQAYKRWMELQDPTLIPSLRNQGYYDKNGVPTEKAKALEAMLTPEAKAWAEWQLNEFYPKYWETVNEVYRDIYGTDMPHHGNYSPIFVADKLMNADAAIDHMLYEPGIRGVAGNNHLLARTNHAKQLLLMDGDKVLMNYIDRMEYFKNWAQPVRDMNAVFSDRGVRESIRQNFGSQYNQSIDFFLDQFAQKGRRQAVWERTMDNLRKNFTIGSLAFKPVVAVKQLTSFPAYADNIPVSDFIAGVADFAANFNTAVKTMNEIPFMQERYSKGWDRDVELAMKQDLDKIMSGGANQASFVDIMMYLTKWGDRAAIHMGGWSVYKYGYDQAIKEGLSVEDAKMAAERRFVEATRSSQQASSTADLSQIQSSHWMFKWMTMYKTSQLQYHRKVMEATRNIAYGRGSIVDNAKKIVIYHALLPSLFQLVSNGFKWDGEDQLRAVTLGNFNAPFALGDIAAHAADKIQGNPFGYNITPVETLVSDGEKIPEELRMIKYYLENPEYITVGDFLDATKGMSTVIGHMTGTPVKGVHNTLSGIADVVDGDTEYPARRILGWSEYKMDNAEGIGQGYDKDIGDMMRDNKTPVTDIKKEYERRVPPPPPRR